jgi:hypothetical protein
VPDAELYDGVRVRLGHVRNSRFGSGQVIPGTNCAKSRALRRAK